MSSVSSNLGAVANKTIGGSLPTKDQANIRQEAREASFGIEASGGLGGRSREQVEFDIFQGRLNQARIEDEKRRFEEEKARREREELLARIRGARDEELRVAKDTPGRKQVLLSSGPRAESALGGGLV